MKQIFQRLLEILKKEKSIRWIDLDKGQLDYYQTRPAVAFPCLLIKIDFPKIDSLATGVQDCNSTITIRLAFDYLGSTSANTQASIMEDSLQYFDTVEKIQALLQDTICIDNHTMMRTSQNQETRPDGLTIMKITYKTRFLDKKSPSI